MKPIQTLSFMLAALLFSASAYAHHSAPAFFDVRGFTSVAGTISGNRLENPHSYYRLVATDGITWAWESGPSWTALAKLGWSQETLPNGTRVRMSGIPALTDKPIARFDHISVFLDDGGLELYGVAGRDDWAVWARENGTACATGIEDCARLTAAQFNQLQQQFGQQEVWYPAP